MRLNTNIILIIAAFSIISCKKKEILEESSNSVEQDTNNPTTLRWANIDWNPDINYGSIADVDGNSYKTVTIGNQTWMAENLRTTKYQTGETINNITELNELASVQKDCYWKPKATNFEDDDDIEIYDFSPYFGYAYSLEVIINNKNVCPSGWKIPNSNDWSEMFNFLENENEVILSEGNYKDGYGKFINNTLISVDGWYSGNYDELDNDLFNIGGQDKYGFRILPTENPVYYKSTSSSNWGYGAEVSFSSKTSDDSLSYFSINIDPDQNPNLLFEIGKYKIDTSYYEELTFIRCVKE